MSLCVLIAMSVIIVFTWTENYGDTSVGNAQSYKNALTAIMTGAESLVSNEYQSKIIMHYS